MCWNQPASAAFAAIGFGTAALLRARGRPPHRWSLFVFFGIMEVIQFLVRYLCKLVRRLCTAFCVVLSLWQRMLLLLLL